MTSMKKFESENFTEDARMISLIPPSNIIYPFQTFPLCQNTYSLVTTFDGYIIYGACWYKESIELEYYEPERKNEYKIKALRTYI